MTKEPQELLELIEKKERKARLMTLIYSVIPVVLAVILVIFTGNKIKQLNEIKKERAIYIKDIDSLQVKIRVLQKQLENSTNFISSVHQLNWSTAKMIYSRYPKQSMMLSEIMHMKDARVKWKIGSIDQRKGFDSPSFAVYMINKFSRTKVDEKDRYKLKEMLTAVSAPGVGDIIFYEWGYAMFYFKDEANRPYCIGMTPAGIVALDINFGPKILGYGKIDY